LTVAVPGILREGGSCRKGKGLGGCKDADDMFKRLGGNISLTHKAAYPILPQAKKQYLINVILMALQSSVDRSVE
jgi:hypothetical protein